LVVNATDFPETASVSVGGSSFTVVRKKTGVNGYLKTGASFPDIETTGFTMYVVASQGAVSGDGGGVFAASGGNVRLTRGALDTVSGKVGNNTATALNTAATNDTFYTFRLRYPGSGVDQFLSKNNGTELTNSAVSHFYVSTPFTVLSDNGLNYGDKQILEVIVYTGNHDATDRDGIEAYLQEKYGHY
jgi:hypothetical protein